MIVSKKHKALVLKLRNPDLVTTVIPSSKILNVKGNKYVAVRHGLDEVKVLRNIGIQAPSPIHYYYDWPGRFKPFNAQREAAGFFTLNNRAFNLSEMGTGKTMATLWAFDYLRSMGAALKALIVTPLSTLERTWADEIFNHFPHLNASVLYGNRDKRLRMLNTDADIYLINHDGIKVSGFVEAIQARTDINLVIIDEIAQVARNAGTGRYSCLKRICAGRDVWGLTGTPTPNAPTDAWAQCRLVSPDKVPVYFNRFKDAVMKQITQYVWVPRPNAMDIVYQSMQPAIRFTRDECVDLPPCMYETRQTELTPEQSSLYKQMLTKLKAEAEEGQILAVNEAVKAQKLIQIACGVAYTSDGDNVVAHPGPRLEVLREVIEEAGTKVIVFVPFVGVLNYVADFLRAHQITVECIHGSVSKAERDRIFQDFQHSSYPKVLVAQPAAMSHGLTLTSASTIVWYAPITSADIFEQANARITRPGQKHNQFIVMIEGTEIERKYYKRLKDKQKLQGTLLDLVRDSRVTN